MPLEYAIDRVTPEKAPIKKPCGGCAYDGAHDCSCAACKEAGWAYFEPFVPTTLDVNILRKLEAIDDA